MKMVQIQSVISEKHSGEWGLDAIEGSPSTVTVIRTTNFENNGQLNLTNTVKREIIPNKIKRKKLQTGDVIIEKSGGSPTQPVGRVVFFSNHNNGIFLCNNFTTVLRPNMDIISPKYLFQILFYNHTNGKTIKYQNKTTGIINLKLDEYLKSEIPLPPLTEQKRIAAILDKADAIRKKRRQALDMTDTLLKSVFLDMFGDPVTNPKGWEQGIIRDGVSDVKYGTSKPAMENGKYVYLRMNNITYSGVLDLAKLKYIDMDKNEVEKYIARKGDVLFNRTNSKELVGKTCVFTEEQEMIIAGYIIRVRTNQRLTPEYLSAFLNSKYGKETLFLMCKSIVWQANINAQELQNINILFPPIVLQNKFSVITNTIRKNSDKIQLQFNKADNAFKSLQQSFFG